MCTCEYVWERVSWPFEAETKACPVTRTDEVRQTDVNKLLLTELENSLWTSLQGKTVGWGRERYGMQNNKRDGVEMKKSGMVWEKLGNSGMLRKTRVKEETMVRTKKERWSSGHDYCAAKTTREAPRYLNTWKLCKLHKRAYLSWAHKYAKNLLLCVHIYMTLCVCLCKCSTCFVVMCTDLCKFIIILFFFHLFQRHKQRQNINAKPWLATHLNFLWYWSFLAGPHIFTSEFQWSF